ncbi:MAG: hypothetical protein KF782_26920 [Labilithrix sp.]|nr:hypothetical protein [Labilithrix sp.]
MAENTRPPVAVRIVRPYETEDAFLENELETVGKTSVILIGAHSRPTGVILRFEVTLASGATILRGEGRVLAHKESAFRGQPGLALRFTRLDPKSKALVDRAAAIREARLAGGVAAEAPPPAPSSASLPAQASAPEPRASEPAAPEPSAPPPQASEPSAPPPAPAALHGSQSSTPPAPHAMSLPPDPVLAQILTAPTPPPPAADARGRRADRRRSTAPDRRSERPTGAPAPDTKEGTTPPPALAPLVEGGASESANPHAMATVALTAAHGASPTRRRRSPCGGGAHGACAPEARTAPAPGRARRRLPRARSPASPRPSRARRARCLHRPIATRSSPACGSGRPA